MGRDSLVSVVRRKVMGFLTGWMGRDKGLLTFENSGEIERILVVRPNGRLGNQLMLTPLLQELERLFPEAKFDLYVKSRVAPILFQNYRNLGEIIILPNKPFKQFGLYVGTILRLFSLRYDLVINAAGSSSSGRLMTSVVKSKYKVFCSDSQLLAQAVSDYHHLAKHPVYSLRHYMRQDLISSSVPTLSIQLSSEEVERGREIIESIVGLDKPVIGIYTFATGAKCFSKEWWADLYAKLCDEFGEQYSIMEVLPIENVSQIDFKAPSYYSRDIREMLGVMDHFAAFVTADCGIMHLASATRVPVLSIFSTTSPEIYRPYNVGSRDLKAAELESNDEIITDLQSILGRK